MRDVYTVLVLYTYALSRNNNIYVKLFHLTMFFIKHTSGTTCVCAIIIIIVGDVLFLYSFSLSENKLEDSSIVYVSL